MIDCDFIPQIIFEYFVHPAIFSSNCFLLLIKQRQPNLFYFHSQNINYESDFKTDLIQVFFLFSSIFPLLFLVHLFPFFGKTCSVANSYQSSYMQKLFRNISSIYFLMPGHNNICASLHILLILGCPNWRELRHCLFFFGKTIQSSTSNIPIGRVVS